MKNYLTDSFQGMSHFENQDGILVLDEADYTLFFVFDGVSRSMHPKKGVELAIDYISKNHKNYFATHSYNLAEMVYDVNECILSGSWENALTTYCGACRLKQDAKNLIISNLGDSRIYLVNPNEIRSVTIDDTIFPGSNVLTKCLGMNTLSREDFMIEKLELQNNNFLLCSDGFYTLVEANPDEFISIFKNNKTNVLKQLLEEKIKGNNIDDSSYIYAIVRDEF